MMLTHSISENQNKLLFAFATAAYLSLLKCVSCLICANSWSI